AVSFGRLVTAVAALLLVACGAAPVPTPTPPGRATTEQLATAQAAGGATVAAARATAPPTPGAVAAVGGFRLWLLSVEAPAELAGRHPGVGEKLVRLDVGVENTDIRPRNIVPGVLVSAALGKPEDALLRFELDTGSGTVAA